MNFSSVCRRVIFHCGTWHTFRKCNYFRKKPWLCLVSSVVHFENNGPFRLLPTPQRARQVLLIPGWFICAVLCRAKVLLLTLAPDSNKATKNYLWEPTLLRLFFSKWWPAWARRHALGRALWKTTLLIGFIFGTLFVRLPFNNRPFHFCQTAS